MSQTTKHALEASLKELLQQKPLNKITVSEIAENCEVNRMTFYYHFKDIYDLVEWCCVEDAAKALKGKKSFLTWQEGFLNTFHVILENKLFVKNVYRSISKEQITAYIGPLVHDLVLGVVKELSAGMTVSEADQKFIAGFYEYAFLGIVRDWIERDMKEDPEEIVSRTSILVHGNISRALEAFRTDRISSDPVR
ncbi:MAG: TetR family transcriptional regulator [Oscillospiraceae bacterium]|nr:TetR family transcriptional regulator [Oscillospiraceae bacterium]